MTRLSKLLRRLSRSLPYGVNRTKQERSLNFDRDTKFDNWLPLNEIRENTVKAEEVYSDSRFQYKDLVGINLTTANLYLEDGDELLLESGFRLLLEG